MPVSLSTLYQGGSGTHLTLAVLKHCMVCWPGKSAFLARGVLDLSNDIGEREAGHSRWKSSSVGRVGLAVAGFLT